MTTTPNPVTVRKIAREHIRSGRTDIGTTIIKHLGNGVLSDEEFAAWEYEVTDAWRRELRTVTWPDEQEPLRDEYAVRVVYTSTREAEGAIGPDRDEAEARAAQLAARDDVVSAVPLHRKAGDWHVIGGDRG